jgi:hypothetical protein
VREARPDDGLRHSGLVFQVEQSYAYRRSGGYRPDGNAAHRVVHADAAGGVPWELQD